MTPPAPFEFVGHSEDPIDRGGLVIEAIACRRAAPGRRNSSLLELLAAREGRRRGIKGQIAVVEELERRYYPISSRAEK